MGCGAGSAPLQAPPSSVSSHGRAEVRIVQRCEVPRPRLAASRTVRLSENTASIELSPWTSSADKGVWRRPMSLLKIPSFSLCESERSCSHTPTPRRKAEPSVCEGVDLLQLSRYISELRGEDHAKNAGIALLLVAQATKLTRRVK
jgi:hypothetical protein